MPGVRRLNTYAEASALFDKAKLRTNTYGRSGTHAMPSHSADFTGLSKDHDGTICFIYHSTTVVQWHPDNTCTLDLNYESQSTAVFADRFMPRGASISGECKALRSGGAYYKPGARVRLDAEGRLTHASEDTHPIARVRVDRKKANKAMEGSGLKDFLAWYKPMAALLGNEQMHRENHYNSDLVTSLLYRDQWEKLRTCSRLAGARAHVSVVERVLRESVYERYDAYYTEEHASAPDYGSFTAWVKSSE
jgi:hypothetical protein